MTPRELCRSAIAFEKPERLPMNFPTCGHMDLAVLPYTAPQGWTPSEPGADEWGAVWRQTDVPNMGQMKVNPIKEWADLDAYVFPDPDAAGRFDRLAQRMTEFPELYIVAIAETVLTLWERYYSLRGFTQALQDPYMYPDETHDLLERVLGFHLGIVAGLGRRFAGRVDAFLVSDDWGTQSSTLFSLPLWREFFKDPYRRLFGAIHDAGMHVIMHSDGRINDYLPDLIDVGVDAFNLHSPTVVGIEEIGRRFAGKVAFLPCIDIQNTYVRGSVEDVRREAAMLLAHWGTREGGIIPCEYDRVSVGATLENTVAAYETFRDLGLGYCGSASANVT